MNRVAFLFCIFKPSSHVVSPVRAALTQIRKFTRRAVDKTRLIEFAKSLSDWPPAYSWRIPGPNRPIPLTLLRHIHHCT